MILLLDSSTPTCRLSLIDGYWHYDDEWQADRELAEKLLGYLETQLQKNGKTWRDISAIGVMKGPGSFTGLRIGLSVLNTLADTQKIPIVGAKGDNWQQNAQDRLANSENDQIVLPFYDRPANTTIPRK